MSLALPLKSENEAEEVKNTMTREKVENTLTDELIFGLCTPIGSVKEPVINAIIDKLKNIYGYTVRVIKLSDFINMYVDDQEEQKPGETIPFTNLMNKIKGGNALRERHNAACLVELAIREINTERMGEEEGKIKKTEDLITRRTCYIIDSLKNIEELILLRSVYKDIFYQFSIFSPESERKKNLHEKHMADNEVEKLMNTDDYENNEDGQNVRNVFVNADFFIRVSNSNIDTIPQRIERYLHLIFESKIITPNPNEIAMYEAKSAAGNSACLSRQVGAAITNQKGEIISRGWNDVPKFGGNLYKDGDSVDKRCISNGFCSNDTTKDNLAENILEIILKDDIFKTKPLGESQEIISNRLKKSIRKSTKIKDLIEFSRAVHAEMHAIIIGSQLAGNQMLNGKLYCTTYPCHNCGRHIVVAGIKEIYYIEPYVKSLCITLHPDVMTEDETVVDKVKILMYDGVAPRRYLEFFMMKTDRKDSKGHVINHSFRTISPKSRLSLQALSTLEAQA